MRPSMQYERDARRLIEFREAYVDLINHGRAETGPLGQVVVPATDNETWQRKRHAVALAVGGASSAYARFGGTLSQRNAGYLVQDVDPLVNWEISLKDPEQLSPHTLVACVESAAATAKRMEEDARERERGLTGMIAAFLRWPTDLREAVGDGHPAQRNAARAIGVLGQVVVGTVAGALATGVVAASVQLWRLLT